MIFGEFKTRPVHFSAAKLDEDTWQVVDGDGNRTHMSNADFRKTYQPVDAAAMDLFGELGLHSVLTMNTSDIQVFLRHIDKGWLAVAMKTASPDICTCIFQAMSDRAFKILDEDIHMIKAVSEANREKADLYVRSVLKHLHDTDQFGDLFI